MDWPKFVARAPKRAVAMLGASVRKAALKQLVDYGHPHWAHRLAETSVVQGFGERGREVWDELRPWWTDFQVEELSGIHVKWDSLEDAPIVSVVEIMARAVATALAGGDLAWDDLRRALPGDLRDQDGWLLLRVGHFLAGPASENRTAAAERLSAWFASDPRWAHIRLGVMGSRWNLSLARAFLESVAPLLPDAAFSPLEAHVISYVDPWTVKDEQRRWDGRSVVWPNTRGATTHLLLPALPASRRSAVARSVADRLERKFGAYDERMFKSNLGGGGFVRSVVPLEVAKRWSASEWKKRLATAPQEGRWRHPEKGGIATYDLSTLCGLLARAAQSSPRAFREIVREFDESVPATARADALRGIAQCGSRVEGDGEPLSDTDLIQLVELPAYLNEPECARDLVGVVESRDEAPWPETVICRLEAIAAGQAEPGVRLEDVEAREDGLAMYRLNDPACRSLDVLGRLAHVRHELRPRVLAIAELSVRHEDPGRRASAANAASCVYDEDGLRVATIMVTAAQDPRIAAERDIWQGVAWLAGKRDVWPELATRAISALLALPSDRREHLAKVGGAATLLLHARGHLGGDRLREIVRDSIVARRAAADLLARWLGDAENEWEGSRALAVEWANDPDSQVGDEIVSSLRGARAQLLAEDRAFIEQLVASPAGARNVDDILELFDRANDLTSVADSIFGLAGRLIAERGGQQDWRLQEHARALCARLARLIEESERRRDWNLRTRALDAWDGLLLGEGIPAAQQELATQMEAT